MSVRRSRVDLVHDVSLGVWALLAAARAAGRYRAGPAGAVVVGINLLAGSPAALHRVRQRRRDPVALLAPAAVAGAIVTSVRPRPRWAPLAAVTVLIGLAVAERRVCASGRGMPAPRCRSAPDSF